MFARALLITITAAMLCSCYGKASPETCHAKHIRDGRGDDGAYDRCMATYERESHSYSAEKRRLKVLRVQAESARLERELEAQ